MALFKLLCLLVCFNVVLCQFGFFPPRDERRISQASPFGILQNFIPDRNRIRNTLNGVFNPQSNDQGYVVNQQNNGRDTQGGIRFPGQQVPYDNVYDDRNLTKDYQTQQEQLQQQQIQQQQLQQQQLEQQQLQQQLDQQQLQQQQLQQQQFQNQQQQNDDQNANSGLENHFGDSSSGLISGTVGPVFGGRQDGLVFGDSGFDDRNANPSQTATENPFSNRFEDTCQTVEGGSGSCLPLNKCEPYLKLVTVAKSDPRARSILQKSHCGFEGNLPKVCCPRPGIPTAPPTAAPTPAPTSTTQAAVTDAAPRNDAAAKNIDAGDYVTAFPEPPICGVSNGSFSRVVGGVDAKLGDFVWVTLLGYQGKRDSGTRWRCGGSLITNHHVLTAAHCIHNLESELYVVRLGELDTSRDDDGASPIDVLLKSKIKHENYSPTSFENDIGVLIMEQFIEFTDLIRPICLPLESSLRNNRFERYSPMIAGWGDVQFRGPSATHLQVVQLPVQTNELCKKAYVKYPKQVIDDRVLCAGYKNGGKDACQGDSGGPLMLPVWNNVTYKTYFYQIGVVSYGKNCAEAGFPGVYSRITHFLPWLEKIVLGI